MFHPNLCVAYIDFSDLENNLKLCEEMHLKDFCYHAVISC